MTEGQRNARNIQRWLMAMILACFPALVLDTPRSSSHVLLAMFVMASANLVIDAMRGLAKDRE